MPENQELVNTKGGALAQPNAPLGFENEQQDDLIIPRVKVINALSPERKAGEASEGDIINSLTKDKLSGKVFVPVFKFNNHIRWRDRTEGGGIACIARDGKMGEVSDGQMLMCAACKRCEFDNTKQGKESLPSCTKYINFFGFIEGERIPLILSFSKTSYSEGKKMYSLAKVTMQNMFNYGYSLNSKLMAKNGNEWYNIVIAPAGTSGDDDRAFAHSLYESFRDSVSTIRYDMDETNGDAVEGTPPSTDGTEY